MVIDIDKIVIRDRIRKDFGDIEELANDIKENGLINPPVVNKNYELLAGERRLMACKSLGWNQIEIRMMDTRDAEHELNVEISENDVRKGFSKSERVDYMKRLLRIEEAKAKDRQNLGQKSDEGARADDSTAKHFDVSRDTMRKEMSIVDNKDLISVEDFNNWDEGKLSTNKAYQRIKAELERQKQQRETEVEHSRTLGDLLKQANAQIKDLESKEPEIKEIVKEIVPDDYKEIKNKAKAYDEETARLNKKLQAMYDKRNELEDQIKELQKERVQEQANQSLLSDAVYFISKCGFFIQDVAGYVWLADKLKELPDKEREQYVRAATAVRDWSVALLQSIERDKEYGEPEIQKLIAESTEQTAIV